MAENTIIIYNDYNLILYCNMYVLYEVISHIYNIGSDKVLSITFFFYVFVGHLNVI